MTIRATINDKQFKKLFRELNGAVTNLRPALIKIGGMLEDAAENAFERQGPGWKSLKPATKKRKIKEFGGAKKILEGEGALSGSVSSRVIGVDTAAVGSASDYARPHNEGSPKQGIPKRKFLIVGPAEINKSLFILSKHLLKPAQ
jgi:phage gpG-like protein